jgi:hypothetical protein
VSTSHGPLDRFFRRCMAVLESRRGRKAFWAVVVAFGLLLGSDAVIRAEFPKEVHVARLHYDSPTWMGRSVDEQARYHSSEFREFRGMSWGAVMEGLDEYADFGHVRAYPPFFPIAFFPFAFVWRIRGLGSGLFFLVGYAGSLLAAWWLARWWQRRDEPASFGLFALTWLLMAPFVGAVLGRCETDMLVIVPLAAAFLLMAREEKEGLAGVLLGFAASFKILPGLFGVYLLCRRRWRAVAGMAFAGLFCSVLLPVLVWGPTVTWQRYGSWYHYVVAPYGGEGATGVIGRPYRSTNQSLTAAVHRFLTPIRAGKDDDMRKVNVADLSSAAAAKVASVLHGLIAIGLLALWLTCRHAQDGPAGRAALFATVPLGILLLSEVSLTTHHVTLLIPIVMILGRAVCLDDPRARRVLWCVAGALLLCVVGMQKTIHLLSPVLFATLLFLYATVRIAVGDCRQEASAAV